LHIPILQEGRRKSFEKERPGLIFEEEELESSFLKKVLLGVIRPLPTELDGFYFSLFALAVFTRPSCFDQSPPVRSKVP